VLLSEVERVLKAHGVTRRSGEVVLVACSGGVDSVVLAHACAELLGGRRVVLAHVDHQVRAESGEDARFVECFASVHHLDSRVVALRPGSPASEAALRRARYDALESMRQAVGAKWILTAHTRNDQAETVLLAIVRSGRATTLRGIPIRRGAILRPLLRVSRDEIRDYAASLGLEHREDPTNREPMYLRNRIRKELLPLLERRYRAHMGRRLARLARSVAAMTRRRRSRPDPEVATRRIPSGPDGFGSPSAARRRTCSAGNAPGPVADRVPRTETASTPGAFVIAMERRPWSGGPIPDGRTAALFDAAALDRPTLRLAEAGDRIAPFGMEGRRKITDLMREAAIPPDMRASVTIVANGAGDVVWVPGVARSNEAPIGPLTRFVWAFWIVPIDGDREGLAPKT
jgi:tRNA(Ile)-lysidine synthase